VHTSSQAMPCRAILGKSTTRFVSARLSSPLPQASPPAPACVRAPRGLATHVRVCAQHSAAALLCLLLAAVGVPTRAELSQSEFNRIMIKFRAQAQGASAVSNHRPRFLC
jgi:hypothetical protein